VGLVREGKRELDICKEAERIWRKRRTLLNFTSSSCTIARKLMKVKKRLGRLNGYLKENKSGLCIEGQEDAF
jgi:thioredoxin-related protein